MRTEPISSLARNAGEILSKLQEDLEPVLITHHGKPAARLVDVAHFESLERRMALLEGIARGEKAIAEGRVLNRREARTRMEGLF